MSFFRSKNASVPSHKDAEDPNHSQAIAKSAMTSILGNIGADDDPLDDGHELDAAIRMTQRASQRTDPEHEILPGFNLVNLTDDTNGQKESGQQPLASMPYVKGPHGEPLALDDEDAINITEPEMEDMDMVTSNMAVLSESTEIKGDVSVKGDMRICGVVHGNVFSDGSIIVGGGRVDGDVKAKSIRLDPGSEVNGNLTSEGDAVLSGSVTGNVTAHDLKLCKGSILKGSTITAQLFSVEGGAIIDSALHIGLVAPEPPKKERTIQMDHARPNIQPQAQTQPQVQRTVKQPNSAAAATGVAAAAAN